MLGGVGWGGGWVYVCGLWVCVYSGGVVVWGGGGGSWASVLCVICRAGPYIQLLSI